MLPFLAFVFGTALVGGAALLFMPRREEAIDRRLQELMSDREDVQPAKPRWQALIGVFKRIGDKVPRSPKEMGTLRLRLVQAGYRRDEALTIFFGIRVLFAVVLFLLLSSALIIRPNTLVALGGLCLGYLLPGMVLARLAKRRAHRVRMSLADALDLLVVSVEAGLGLDQALTRVGTELAFAYPELADELKLINLELRAGKPRAEALRNLADRTGVDDLSSLVTMLIQTDKFGTSVAQSLRVYSETLRTKRRQRAEEAAAKTGVKMVFPLVLCIFPSIWVVTIGPAAIKFVTVLFPMIENMKK
ncbi:MAG: type II secretion system F family protein [Acidobacteriota bacterium]|nr:type II secretion system F family protein [Acidobacteriota bacterium]